MKSEAVVHRMPYSGQCEAIVSNKRQRRFNNGPSTDYVCRIITDTISEGQWRCRLHLAAAPVFQVLGVFEDAR